MRMGTKQLIADTATYGGASITGGSWYINSLGFLNDNHHAILSVCGMVGAVVALVGIYYTVRNAKLLRQINQAKLKQLLDESPE